MEKSEMIEFATIVAGAVVDALEGKKVINCGHNVVHNKPEKSAYSKTEALLYNYNGFKRIVEEREEEIAEILTYGVPQNKGVREFVQKGGMPHGLVTEEEAVNNAVASIRHSVEGTIAAINLIDKAMDGLRNDPYYEVLPMTYFEGRTQEDIADYIGCSQVSISKNKNRLVKELSLKLFPDQVIREMLS